MVRWAHLPVAFVALAAWAGAQGPAPEPQLSPADQVRLLKANGTLIGNLVDHGVQLAGEDHIEKRAEECHKAALALANAIRDAAARQDAARVAELTALFRDVVKDGLLPTLKRGDDTVPPQSPAAATLRRVREAAAKDVSSLKAAIPAVGKVGESARVRDALKGLDELVEPK
ncbi:MAG: hypothetical protein ACKODX_02020 [Gemmata sp.]|jgi:cytochrome c5